MPLLKLGAIASKIGGAVKNLTTKVSSSAKGSKFFTKIGDGVKNMFSKGRTNIDEYGNPFGKLGQAVGNMFRKDSTPNNNTNGGGDNTTNSISNYLPFGIVGLILYLILKK